MAWMGYVWPMRFLVLAGVLACAATATAQSQPELQGYAVLGFESVRVGPRVIVQPGAVGVLAGSVRLAPRVSVSGSVVGDSIRVARSTQVGRLFCRLVSGGAFGPGAVTGPTVGGSPVSGCRTLTTPVVDPALLAPVAVTPGSNDLIVGARQGGAPVAAASFGAVKVGHGGVLQLAGGSYQFRSIRLAAAARLVCLADCRIGVADSVRIGPRAQLGTAQGLPRNQHARVDIAAASGEPFAFRGGPKVIVEATIFSPTGVLLLGPAGDYRGAYVGRSVVLRPRVRVREDSAFPPPARR